MTHSESPPPCVLTVIFRQHSKASARFTRSSRLDGGIQRKQIGLSGNIHDRLGKLIDLLH